MIENTLLQLLAQVGGLAGIISAVALIWVLRQQAAQTQLVRDQHMKLSDQYETGERENRVERRALTTELIEARKETNEIIRTNTEALVLMRATLKQLCNDTGNHQQDLRERLERLANPTTTPELASFKEEGGDE